MLKVIRTATATALLALPLAANALYLQLTEVTCPIDGTKFQYSRVISGSSFGTYLDLQPFGMVAAPAPLAKCPGNGFVMYKDKFSDEEIARLKTYVNSAEYQALQKAHKPYYLAAQLQRVANESPRLIAAALLRATWQAWGEDYTRYATEALEAYREGLALPAADAQQWFADQLIAGELERRLGKFDDAKTRFGALTRHAEIDRGIHRDIVELQLKLIDAKDNFSHKIPEHKTVSR